MLRQVTIPGTILRSCDRILHPELSIIAQSVKPKSHSMDFSKEISSFLQLSVSQTLNLPIESVKVLKRNRNLKEGDFFLPRIGPLYRQYHHPAAPSCPCPCECQNGSVPCERCCSACKSVQRNLDEKFAVDDAAGLYRFHWDAKNTGLHGWIKIQRWLIKNDSDIHIMIDRSSLFLHILRNFATFTDAAQSKKQKVIINCTEAHKSEDAPMNISELRSILLCRHIENLLNANGYACERQPKFLPDVWKDICPNFNIAANTGKLNNENEGCSSSNMDHFAKSPYRICIEGSSDCKNPNDGESAKEKITLDLKTFISDNNLPVGKNGFDKNIDRITLPAGDILHHLTELKSTVEKTGIRAAKCLHIGAKSRSFQIQQLHLLWRMISNSEEVPNQVHLVHGGVSQKGSSSSVSSVTVDEYLRITRGEIENAFLLKYGDVVRGSGWQDTIDQLSSAVICMELLNNTSTSQVKIDTSPCQEIDTAASSSPGVFIMYNYARLSTLLHNFHKAVSDSVYPPLPPIESIDFSYLREEEEWSLLFNYLLPYPTMIADTVREIEVDKLRPNIHTHKVCQFLHDLSRDVSSYYSRVHILTECREQLLPVMFARLHLLQVIHICAGHGLQLLGIKPMSQL